MLESKELPFQYTADDLARQLLVDTETPAYPMGYLDEIVLALGQEGVSDIQQLTELGDFTRFGGLFTLASLVSAHHPITEKWPDGHTRFTLYMAAETHIMSAKQDLAAAEFGVFKLHDHDELRPHVTAFLQTLEGFQAKLLERVSPTPPQMKK